MSVISGIVGSQAQESSASKAASAEERTAALQTEAQKEMFNKLLALQQPYNELGLQGISGFSSANPTAGLEDAKTQLKDYPELNLPSVSLDSFNYAFDPNDPTYQYRKSELEKTINEQAAARGNYNSRPTINALSEGNIALTANESQNQFSRALDTYNANIGTQLSQFGADYQRATDTYNTGYGKLTDLYNLTKDIGTTNYQKILDAIKIGSGAAGSAGSGAIATGQGLANTYGQLGNSLAQTQIAKGQATSDLWSGIGSTTGTIGSLALLKHYGLL